MLKQHYENLSVRIFINYRAKKKFADTTLLKASKNCNLMRNNIFARYSPSFNYRSLNKTILLKQSTTTTASSISSSSQNIDLYDKAIVKLT